MLTEFERTPQLRASDADREAAAERLRIAAGDGRIDADELDERLSRVYGARWCSELVSLTADVTPPPDRPMRPVFVQRPPAKVNLYAVASLLAGLFGIGSFGVFALPLGFVALRQIRESEGAQLGRSLALIGVALGFISVLIFLLMLAVGGLWAASWD